MSGSDDNIPEKDPERKVIYVCDEELIRLSDKLPKIPNRASSVHALIQECGLMNELRLFSSRAAKNSEIQLFHSQAYIDCVRKLSERDDEEIYDEEDEMFGLTYDCPAFPGVYEYACRMAGGSVVAADSLIQERANVAMHWTGGWHHAKRDEASGFCYFNDIVIAILKLRQKFDRVLYIDIDLHHGDGVEDAFCTTPKVMTVSFHKYSSGFFPGTGRLEDVGIGKGRHYTVNVPLKDGMQDKPFVETFQSIMEEVHKKYQPQAVVCQCGADCLVGDPMESFNLTPQAYLQCVQCILKWKLPLLLLGGGGYNIANTARCWTQITALVLGQTLPQDIPEHQYFPLYGPDYEFSLSPGNRPDLNTRQYIDSVVGKIKDNLQHIQPS